MEAAVIISCIGIAFSLGYFVVDHLGCFLEETQLPPREDGPRLRVHARPRILYRKVS